MHGESSALTKWKAAPTLEYGHHYEFPESCSHSMRFQTKMLAMWQVATIWAFEAAAATLVYHMSSQAVCDQSSERPTRMASILNSMLGLYSSLHGESSAMTKWKAIPALQYGHHCALPESCCHSMALQTKMLPLWQAGATWAFGAAAAAREFAQLGSCGLHRRNYCCWVCRCCWTARCCCYTPPGHNSHRATGSGEWIGRALVQSSAAASTDVSD